MKAHLPIFAAMAFGLGIAMPAAAKQLTPGEALSRVTQSGDNTARRLVGKAQPTPLLKVSPATDPSFVSLYVFSDNGDGYVIVSADDVAAPLLGYSDSGTLDKDNLPPALNYWLEYYAAEIKDAASASGKPNLKRKDNTERPERAAIAPMLKSKWNQSAPYNDDCPLDNGKRSVTGCVATAMAQAMYYYQWPAQGQGSHTYNWNNTQLTVNFANTTYDWDAMTPTYDSNSTDAAKAAVANLMYSCGVSVDMDYSSDESGASSLDMGPALYKYFNYDKSMSAPQRYFYGLMDWENMIYAELQQNRPVLYGGQSYEGGHQFVCDGYSEDGYFHFNWGWGGMSDGYFLLSALDPMDQGIGGSASQSGFDFDQGILINFMPPKEGSEVPVLIYCYGNFESSATQVVLGKDLTLKSSEGFFNFASTNIEGSMGIKLVNSQGTATYLKDSEHRNFAAITGIEDYKVTLPATLADGTYTVTPAFQKTGSTEWDDVLCPLSGTNQLTMTVSDGVATIKATSSATIEITDFSLNTPIYLDKDFSTSFTITNTGTEEYYGEFNLFLFDEDGEEVAPSADLDAIDLQPGESQTVTYVTKFSSEYETESGEITVQPGQYVLGIFSHFTNQQLYIYQTPVNVQAAPAKTTLSVSNFTVNDGNDVVNTSDVKFTGSVECTEGYFTGQLEVAVFKSGSTSTDLVGHSDYLMLSEGQSADFTAHVNVTAEEGVSESYFAIVYQNSSTEISDPLYFTVTTAGVKALMQDEGIIITFNEDGVEINSEAGIATAAIFDLNGIEHSLTNAEGATSVSIETSALGNGAYILMVTTPEGTAKTMEFMK